MKKRLTGGLVAAVLLVWALVGVHGAQVYGNSYYRYRGFAPPRAPKGVARGRLVHVSFFSQALRQRRSYLIYLPPGYSGAAARGKHFPVLYFLHGAPSTPDMIFNAGRIGVAYDVLLHQHRIRPFLMVMPDGRNGTFLSDTEWANTKRGAYGDFVMNVVHAVDARWSTIPKRKDRLIAGLSEGAYGAINLTLHHLKTFGALEAWSGYTTQSATTGAFGGAPPWVVQANEPSLYLPQVAAEVRKLGLRAYLYTGTKDHSAPQVAVFASQLRAAGAKVTFSTFTGGHTWRMWRDHTPLMLWWASKVLGR